MMYNNLSKVLSYNSFLNFIIGARGVGKTYPTTKFLISQFIKKGYEFVFIRRYKTELQKAIKDNKFFKSIIDNDEFKEHTLQTKHDSFYIDDKLAGYAMTLSTATNLKGNNFPKVKYIVFDEFIIENKNQHYLRDEVDSFLSLIETVSRTRDVKIFMLGNAVSLINPYFIYFNIEMPYNSDIRIYKDGLILVNYIDNEDYKNFKKQTKFGQLVAGTSYEDYAINNNFKDNNKDFIMHKTKNSHCKFGFIYKNITYGVWYDYNAGKVFISNDYNTPYIFSTTNDDMKPNTMMLNFCKKSVIWRSFIDNYKLGNVFYENVKLKLIMQELIRYLI